MYESKNPLVTVIIPAYNHEDYIVECIESVVSQTYTNIQIIVIDDGSTDRTQKNIKEFLHKNDFQDIEFYSKTNEGVCKTLNKGLELAKGKYISILASDDKYSREKILKQVSFMEANESIGMVFTDVYMMRYNKNTEKKWTDYKGNLRKIFKNKIQNENMYERLMVEMLIPAITVMVRKDCFEKIGIFDENLKAEDIDMWLRISKEYPIAFIDEPLAYYRLHDGNASNAALPALVSSLLQILLPIIFKQLKTDYFINRPIKRMCILIRLFYYLTYNKIVKAMMIKIMDSK